MEQFDVEEITLLNMIFTYVSLFRPRKISLKSFIFRTFCEIIKFAKIVFSREENLLFFGASKNELKIDAIMYSKIAGSSASRIAFHLHVGDQKPQKIAPNRSKIDSNE